VERYIIAHAHELQDSVGYLAAALVVAAFYMKKTSYLRVIAIGSNLAFLTYGSLAHLLPVVALHLTLLPIKFGGSSSFRSAVQRQIPRQARSHLRRSR
jgi:hypothetical protein